MKRGEYFLLSNEFTSNKLMEYVPYIYDSNAGFVFFIISPG